MYFLKYTTGTTHKLKHKEQENNPVSAMTDAYIWACNSANISFHHVFDIKIKNG